MSKFTFEHEDKSYTLLPEHCTELYNDELKPVLEISVEKILEMMSQAVDLVVTTEYYRDACEKCPPIVREKKALIPFLEIHFFLFTKKQHPVITNAAPEFEGTTFDRLAKAGEVDDSYVVSMIVCPDCGTYQIQIDQVDM